MRGCVCLLWAVILLLTAATPASAQLRGGPLAPQPRPQPAFRAEDFVEFIGLNASPFDRYLESGRFKGAGTKYPPETFFDLGVRYYRTGLKHDLTPADMPQRVADAFAKYGARPMLLIDPRKDGSPDELVALLKRYPPGVIAEVEGPNEVNNKFPPQELNLRHKGKTDEAAGSAYMDDYYKAIKADPATKDIPVVAFTAIFTDYSLARPHTSFDYSNMHSYQGYDVPSDSLEENFTRFNNILPVGGVIKPFVPTECGYNVEEDKTNQNKSFGSLRAQALNIPMLLAEYYRQGVRRAYLFALHNADGYGLLESDQATKRPSYFALKNLLAAIKDANWNPATRQWEGGRTFAPRALLFDIPNAPKTVHTLVLQKQSGEYLLLIWNEVVNYDSNARKDVTNKPVPVTLQFATPVAGEVAILTQNDRGEYDSAKGQIKDNALSLEVPAAVSIVRLTPAPATGVDAPPAPAGIQARASENGVDLSWDKVPGARSYFVFRNGFHVGTVTEPAYHDASSWLRPGLGYTYAIQAYDAAGGMSVHAEKIVQIPDRRSDLIVTGATTDPANPRPGDKVRFVAKMKNIGDGVTPPGVQCGVSFYIDGKHIGWCTRPGPMKPGEEWTLTSEGGGQFANGQWLATAGNHALKVFADDINRLPEERSKANNIIDQSLYIGPPTKGLLLGASGPAPGQADLTNEGSLDWIHFGCSDKSAVNRKAGGPGLLSALTSVGEGHTDRTSGCPVSIRWSDGAPTKEVADTHDGLWWNCLKHAQTFTVAADDKKTRVVRLYVAGIEGAGCTLTARLSDDSAPAYVSSSWDGNIGHGDWAPVPDGFSAVYTIRFRAASPDQKLTVEWMLTSEPNRFLGQARLQAATLAVGP
jgi:hypothetical protein